MSSPRDTVNVGLDQWLEQGPGQEETKTCMIVTKKVVYWPSSISYKVTNKECSGERTVHEYICKKDLTLRNLT